jgi:hypothetical protein
MVAEILTLEAEEEHLLEDEATRAVTVEIRGGVEAVDPGAAAVVAMMEVAVEVMTELAVVTIVVAVEVMIGAAVELTIGAAVEVTIGADAAMIEVVGETAAGVLDHEKIVAEGKEEGVETIMTTGDGGVDARCDCGASDSSAWDFWLLN